MGLLNFIKNIGANIRDALFNNEEKEKEEGFSTPEKLLSGPLEQELPKKPLEFRSTTPAREVDILPGPRRDPLQGISGYNAAIARGDKPTLTTEPEKPPVSREAVEEIAGKNNIPIYRPQKEAKQKTSVARGLLNLVVPSQDSLKKEYNQLYKEFEERVAKKNPNFKPGDKLPDGVSKTPMLSEFGMLTKDPQSGNIIAMDVFGGVGAMKNVTKQTTSKVFKFLKNSGIKLRGKEKNRITSKLNKIYKEIDTEFQDDAVRNLIEEELFTKNKPLKELMDARNSFKTQPVAPKPGAIDRAKKELLDGTSPPVKTRLLDDGSIAIEDGRHRIQAASELGMKELPAEDVTRFYDGNYDAKFVKDNIDFVSKNIERKVVDQRFREDKINIPDDMLGDLEKRLEALGLGKRKIKTFGDMDDAARELGANPKQLLEEVASGRITDNEVTAIKNLISTNKAFIDDAVKQIEANPEMADIMHAKIDTATQQIDVALSKLVKGGTEAGRAVVAFKKIAENTLDPIFWMTKAKRELGTRNLSTEMQKAIFDLTKKKDINGLAMLVANLREATLAEKALTLWKAGLLTSPTTHMANTAGNITMRALMDASDVVALPLDVMASLITNKRTKQNPLKLISAEVTGAMKGVKEAGRFIRTGTYSDSFLKKWDLPRQVNFKNKILDTYTKTIFKTLGGEDILFRQMAIEKSMAEQAQLIAKNKGLKGGAYKDAVKSLLKDPTNEMVLNAIDAADYATFQSDNVLGDMIVGAKRALAQKEGPAGTSALIGLEILTPFTKTPSNVISRIADFSPAGFIKAIVRAVNPETRSQKNIVEDLSRAITGSGVIALGALLAEKGLMTGQAPEDRKERETLYAHAQPNSILINGYWLELNRVSPLGNLLTLGADIHKLNKTKSGEDLAISSGFSALKNLTQQSYLKGVSGGLEALMDPDRSADKFAQQTVGSLVPSIITRVAKSIDPTLREKDDIVDAFKERLPELRKSLAPKRDIFGEIVKVPSGSKYWFDPFSAKKDGSDDPVIKELIELEHYIGLPEKTIDGVKMNSYEYSEYQRYNGKLLKPVLSALVQSDEWSELGGEEKKEVIDLTMTEIRKGVSDTIFPALMIVRYGLPQETNGEVLREVLRQISSKDGWDNATESQRATQIKKVMMNIPTQ